MQDSTLFKNIRYYFSYQLIYIVLVILLSSIGAFFHFLLDHEISIVESWLHHNHWEILIVSKLISMFFINRWFKVKLYQLKSVRELISELVHWPDIKAVVISVFMLLSYIILGGVERLPQNSGYWYYHLTSFLGLVLFFGIEFIVIAYLDDILNQQQDIGLFWPSIFYTIIFGVAFRLTVPDYYGLLTHVLLCFAMLMLLSGKSFKSWSNVLCFLLVFVAPMGFLFGMDPVWGDDFSPFKLEKKLNLAFLAVIWMVSFCYYKFRDQIVHSVRKLIR